MHAKRFYTLSGSCPDQVGIIARVSGFIAQHRGWILESSYHADDGDDEHDARYFMRMEVRADSLPFHLAEFRERFRPLAESLSMTWKISDSAVKRRVVIMVSKQDDGATTGEGFITETILKNIRVLAIDQAIQEDEEGRKVKVGETATLELTPQQAEIITVAQQMADRLTLALRSVTDTQETAETEADYLVSGNGKRGTVRVFKAGEVSEVGARQ